MPGMRKGVLDRSCKGVSGEDAGSVSTLHGMRIKRESEARERMISKAFLNACVKYVLISVLWMVLERIIYGKVQPRIVDDIIGLILFWYIFKSEL